MPKGGESSSANDGIRQLIKRKAVVKRRITLALNKANAGEVVYELSKTNIDGYLNDVKVLDEKINELFLAASDSDFGDDAVSEFDSQTEYSFSIQTQLLSFKPVK